ncbi:MAG: beta-Ala-His dipeptidase [Lentisphaeria bacterium]|nr:beta-Ala-His dipeptidase [Lentisphaeria bacterium]
MNQLHTLFENEAGLAWQFFYELNQIPRPSGKEGKVREWLVSIAGQKGWDYRIDKTGNIVLVVPGKGTLSKQEPVILQGHMDMVCEKNEGTNHDFDTDPIQMSVKDTWVRANGTTLGADNGVAIALGLAVALADVEDRVPLELLFTIDEERGLTGALELDSSILQGKTVVNLDSEEDGVITIGCAGGIDYTLKAPLIHQKSNREAIEITLKGYRGGHSGVNIHEGRGNAILSMSSTLAKLSQKENFVLHAMNGGSKKNAIPREVKAVISGINKTTLNDYLEQVLSELRAIESNAFFVVGDTETPDTIVSHDLLSALNNIPAGVLAMEEEFPELVETSNSIGIIKTTGKEVLFLYNGRSSSSLPLDQLTQNIQQIISSFGFSMETSGQYPGWKPTKNSSILKASIASYKACFQEEPVVSIIHAGLEAGIVGEKIKSNNLVAYGPTIQNAHSPDEQLCINSFNKTYRWLLNLVQQKIS